MKYRRLPIEDRLATIRAEEGENAMVNARAALLRDLCATEGFQLVLSVLRDLEGAALNTLKTTAGSTERLVGRIQCIEEIRRALTSLLPVGEQPVDWYDEEAEALLTY